MATKTQIRDNGFSGIVPRDSDSTILALAEQFIDAGPESMQSAAEYLWMPHEVSLADLRASGYLVGQVTRASAPWVIPEQSDLSRPIVVSCGDSPEAPFSLWDGVHRMVSAEILGAASLPGAVGLRLSFQEEYSIENGETVWEPAHWQRSLGSQGVHAMIMRQAEALYLDPLSDYFSDYKYSQVSDIALHTLKVLSAYEARAAVPVDRSQTLLP